MSQPQTGTGAGMGTGDNPALLRLSETDLFDIDDDDDIRGRKATDADGENLGKVSDLLIDPQGQQVRFIVVEHGGILGIGANETFIPVDAITGIDDRQVFVDTELENVAGAPIYDPEAGLEAPYLESVYGYYGFTPYWTPGYLPPNAPIDSRPGREI